ncbi:MAG: hypothetical protein WDN46_20335 [Methylocella sp.]
MIIRTTILSLCIFAAPALAESQLPLAKASQPQLAQEPAYPDCGRDKWPCVQRAQPEMAYQSEMCGSVVHRSQQAISDRCHRAYDGPEYSTATKEARKHAIDMCVVRETALDANNLGRPSQIGPDQKEALSKGANRSVAETTP